MANNRRGDAEQSKTAGALDDSGRAGARRPVRDDQPSKTIEGAVLDDSHDEGEETFTLALSIASGAWLQDAEATGTIENTDLMPAALLARFGRVTAEQVVQARRGAHASASRRAIMILATIGAREESTHVATAPSPSRRG